jgi:predicted DsbA family dithiol-disulfide isomerase
MSGEPVTPAAPAAVLVEVFSDYTCPWCYIGWARLEQALQQLPERVVADVVWRPFEIHAEVPLEGMPVEDLPYPPDVWARMQEALRVTAAAEGLVVGNRPKVANTHRALVASAYAQAEEPAAFPAFHAGLFVAYFAEGRDLGDPAVVDDVARGAGLDVERMRGAIAPDQSPYEGALESTTRDARLAGITGTPTFVFDRRFAASGAQPVEVLLRTFEAALAHSRETSE